jgi:hypothetical protein
VQDPGDHDGIDNVILQNFSVPEPASLTSVSLGAACILVALGRHRRRSARRARPTKVLD